MSSSHRPILRARIAAVLAAASLVFGGVAPGLAADAPASPARISPVLSSNDRPSEPLRRLTPRGETSGVEGTGRSGLPSAGSALSALAVVVLVILGAARLWKTHGPKLPAVAPREAIEVLGRCRIESRQSVYLVSLGSRVLVLGSSGGELTTLSEVTDAVEVDLITAQCRDGAGGTSPFSRLFESRRDAAPVAASDESAEASDPQEPAERPFWSAAERRLAARVRGQSSEEGASRAA